MMPPFKDKLTERRGASARTVAVGDESSRNPRITDEADAPQGGMASGRPVPLAGRLEAILPCGRPEAIPPCLLLRPLACAAIAVLGAVVEGHTAESGDSFFDAKVAPLLAERCYECHSHGKKIKGGLALDSRAGWEKGGEGGAVIVPGAPDKSRLIMAVQHGDPDLKMPPKHKLADGEIAVLFEWVKRGAPDPRSPIAAETAGRDWESIYQERLRWWSLQPLSKSPAPQVKDAAWPREEMDRFILAALEAKGLKPSAEAPRRTLARRLSFALTGLPPKPEDVEHFEKSNSPHAYDDLVQSLLDSPPFGERWARHWMDVVHYSDTHGYEWDTPAKNAWMYRDYLIRAFNADVPFKQLVVEQIAGDLLPPRVDARSGLNESIIGPMAMRLGERRHGDNAAADGVTQETMANMIDTVSKGFLGTTVACSQCHDHKLDAVAQRDFYALAGVFMSTRWGVRCADASDRNVAVIDELKRIKGDIRTELQTLWLGASKERWPLAVEIAAPVTDAAANSTATARGHRSLLAPRSAFPDSLATLWREALQRSSNGTTLEAEWTKLRAEFHREREKRIGENKANLRLLADFSREDGAPGWRCDGSGMKHGLVRDGEIVVSDEGDAAVAQVLPAGRWSHVWSMRLAGAVRSPLFDQNPPSTFSVDFAGSKHAAQSFIIDQSFHSERMKFINQPVPGWLTMTAGDFGRLAGGVDQARRRVYLELATKSLNNYFPSRTGYIGMKEAEGQDQRSWFGITRIYQHAAGKAPQDELARFEKLFADESAPQTKEELAARLAGVVMAAVERWAQRRCDSEDVRLINEALAAKWLPNESTKSPALKKLIAAYRETETRLQPDRTIGSADDWNEARNERIGVRGSYTDLGDEVPRGGVRFLGGEGSRATSESSGRLELAQSIASDRNPLTARVFVNRVWLHLFGEGLVRTPDDFGHLGERPVHPELLDYLAARFIEDGWSLKKLVKLMVTSATWRQGSIASENALTADPENRRWHHMPMRRLDAESIRDSILAVAGRLDASLFGQSVDPYRTSQDATKRLTSGPLDGNGRRSLYLKMTLMEPPRFLALFNQPIPKLTAGKRDATNVPDQALALLNDPFVIAMAKHWSERELKNSASSPEQRVEQMFTTAFARPPQPEETARIVKLARRSAELRGADAGALMRCQPVWQDVAHAIFNMKEFIYVQ